MARIFDKVSRLGRIHVPLSPSNTSWFGEGIDFTTYF
jgi:hypothetical protein